MSDIYDYDRLVSLYKNAFLPRLERLSLDGSGLGQCFPFSLYNVLGLLYSISVPYYEAMAEIVRQVSVDEPGVITSAGSAVRFRRYFLLLILGASESIGSRDKQIREIFTRLLALYRNIFTIASTLEKPNIAPHVIGPGVPPSISFIRAYKRFDEMCVALRELCDVQWFGEHPTGFNIRTWCDSEGYYVVERKFEHIFENDGPIRAYEYYPHIPHLIMIDNIGGSLVYKPPPSQRFGVALSLANRFLGQTEISNTIERITQMALSKLSLLKDREVKGEELWQMAALAYCHELRALAAHTRLSPEFIRDINSAARNMNNILRDSYSDSLSRFPQYYAERCLKACNAIREVLADNQVKARYRVEHSHKRAGEVDITIQKSARCARISPVPGVSIEAKGQQHDYPKEDSKPSQMIGGSRDGSSSDVGMKACYIETLHALGYNIPPTAIIPASALFARFANTQISTSKSQNSQAKAWGNKSLSAAIAQETWRMLAAPGNRYFSGTLIVRSSGRLEDTRKRTRAGLYRSVTGVDCIEKLRIAIMQCIQQDVDGNSEYLSGCSVIVQPYLRFAFGGVTFSIDPRNRSDDHTYSEISTNGPSGVTSGNTVSLGATVRRDVLRVTNIVNISNDPELPATLMQTIIKASMSAIELENHLGSPVEIEWGSLETGEVIYLQCRRILTTTLPRTGKPPTDLTDWHVAIEGIPASPGLQRGIVTIHCSDVCNTSKPSVLVKNRIDPTACGFLFKVAAVVCETGGVTSHLSINCRELGIPCIAQAHDAVSLLTPGTDVIVCGTTGRVFIKRSEVKESSESSGETKGD